MKRRHSSHRFWAVLTSFNVLAIIYPLVSLARADNDAAQFLFAVVVVSVFFMLGLIDIVALLMAYSA